MGVPVSRRRKTTENLNTDQQDQKSATAGGKTGLPNEEQHGHSTEHQEARVQVYVLLDEGNDSGFSCEEQKMVLQEDSAVRMQVISLPEQVLQSRQSIPATQP